MRLVGGSEFGTAFFRAEPVANAPDSSKTHFRIKRHQTNWNAETLCQALALISMSIANVKGFLRVQNGEKPAEVTVSRPLDKAAYWEPWHRSPSLTNMSIDTIVAEEHIDRLSKAQLAKRLRQIFEEGTAGAS